MPEDGGAAGTGGVCAGHGTGQSIDAEAFPGFHTGSVERERMIVVRTPIIAGNWKMNKLIGESVDLAEGLKALVAEVSSVEIAVCPTFIALPAVAKALSGSNIAVGAQNCYIEESGAFTAEISPQMIKDAGATWTIIGHSERRHIFGEADDLLNKKAHYALEQGLKVMFCIGETLDERKGGTMNDVLRRQVSVGLAGLSEAALSNVVLAYEPVWAIGTGEVATPEQAEEAHEFVRGVVQEQFGETVAAGMRIQYGGSVKPGNAADLIGKPNVDGFLVGGAALTADSFAGIIKAAG